MDKNSSQEQNSVERCILGGCRSRSKMPLTISGAVWMISARQIHWENSGIDYGSLYDRHRDRVMFASIYTSANR